MQLHVLFTAALLSSTTSASLLSFLAERQSNNTEEAYLDEVCFPNTTSPVIPPCQEIINIQSACTPNGTSPLDLLAHAECMCGGSFFDDWIGCLDCDYVHGARSGAIVSAFNSIITTVSNALCTGTPTADFADLFTSASQVVGYASGTNTGTTDLYPSQTAISLYYTPTVKQGPGPITGSATAATKVATTTSTSASAGETTTGTGSAAAAGSSSSSTSSSKAGAAPTGVWMGALGVVAGGMVMAAL